VERLERHFAAAANVVVPIGIISIHTYTHTHTHITRTRTKQKRTKLNSERGDTCVLMGGWTPLATSCERERKKRKRERVC
jgi:hypothetical protein